MQSLSVGELLYVWERGVSEPPVRRALRLLAAACPDASVDSLARLSIGQRDARLLTLRQWTFGSVLTTQVRCPNCGERLEVTFDVAQVRVGDEHAIQETFTLTLDDYELRFRLPDSVDLEAIADTSIALAAPELLTRCLDRALYRGEEQPLDRLPPSLLDALAQEMARRDPQADVAIGLSCASCHHQWRAVFDVASYFWGELDAWAARLLREVHTLASAYGWSEAEILGMSPVRRQSYLELVGG